MDVTAEPRAGVLAMCASFTPREVNLEEGE
jgi:hypothetical protein